jgi:hypothetical protein
VEPRPWGSGTAPGESRTAIPSRPSDGTADPAIAA